MFTLGDGVTGIANVGLFYFIFFFWFFWFFFLCVSPTHFKKTHTHTHTHTHIDTYLGVCGEALGDGVTGGSAVFGDGVIGIGFLHCQLQKDKASHPVSVVALWHTACDAPPAIELHKQLEVGGKVVGCTVVGERVASQLHTHGPIVTKFSQSSCVSLNAQNPCLSATGLPQKHAKVGDSVVGFNVVGFNVVGCKVVGCKVVGSKVVGSNVVGDGGVIGGVLGDVGCCVVGCKVVGCKVVGINVGLLVVGTSVNTHVASFTFHWHNCKLSHVLRSVIYCVHNSITSGLS